MDFITASRIYKQIQQSSFKELREDLAQSAVRYARVRVDWYLADPEKRREMDEHRRLLHHGLISSRPQ